ncbi:hypothetical protein M0813_28754 [Anaeramoeba flamelloides]|uniref:Uncharacterized protein n=1 Tax=Anaeramoeba flamelloides TaxID=1746091 RepID=A0ABQ8XRR3_9EUKA|nr:hypothetical protein M0813_28754 [Anaeramoeba flamelloides]
MTSLHFQYNFDLYESEMLVSQNHFSKNGYIPSESFQQTMEMHKSLQKDDQKNNDHFTHPQLLPFLQQETQHKTNITAVCRNEENNQYQTMDLKAQEISQPKLIFPEN